MEDPRSDKSADQDGEYLDGRVLVAMPTMPDERFARAVIYMCAHSAEGAMGLIVNKTARKLALSELLVRLEIIDKDHIGALSAAAAAMPIVLGGPVETARGFVLHSDEFHIENSTLAIQPGVSLTASLDILRAIAQGQGPKKAMLALGYASWGPGQLENEIAHNGWLTAPGDSGLVFDRNQEAKYQRALDLIGVDLAFLSNDAGHA